MNTQFADAASDASRMHASLGFNELIKACHGSDKKVKYELHRRNIVTLQPQTIRNHET